MRSAINALAWASSCLVSRFALNAAMCSARNGIGVCRFWFFFFMVLFGLLAVAYNARVRVRRAENRVERSSGANRADVVSKLFVAHFNF
jgi:hypothetical protein